MIHIIVVTRCYHYCDNCNDKCGFHLAGERREPRVLRVEGGRGERSESQKVCLMMIIIQRTRFVFIFFLAFLLENLASAGVCLLLPLLAVSAD